VSPARTEPTVSMAQKARKERPDHPERFPTGSTPPKRDRAWNARPDPKDRTVPLDLPDQLANPADLAAKATTANPAAPAQLVQQAMPAPPDPTENLVPKANLVLTSKLEPKDRLVPKVKKEVPDRLAPTETKDPLANLAHPARLARPADLAKEAKMEAKVQPALLAPKAARVPTPSIVLARIVRRKPKSEFHLQLELDFRQKKTTFPDASILRSILAIYFWISF